MDSSQQPNPAFSGSSPKAAAREMTRPSATQSQRRQRAANVSAKERAASTAIGGALLLLAPGDRRLTRVILRLAGGALLARGVTGRCRVYGALGIDTARRAGAGLLAEDGPVQAQRSITIGRPAQQVYEFWRNPKNLKLVMGHFAELTDTQETMHWRVPGPHGAALEWDTQLTDDKPAETLQWHSVDGGPLRHASEVSFAPAPDGWGTVVTLRTRFEAAAGASGAMLRAMRFIPKVVLGQALRRSKSLIETGEIPTADPTPAAR